MREVPCPECGGARLKPESLAVTVGGPQHLRAVHLLHRGGPSRPVGRSTLSDRDHMIADRVFKEVQRAHAVPARRRASTTCRSPARPATLSGGEAQRIRLASQIGSGLVGVLYVLDEPSIGLHQRDNQRLIGTLERLRDLGNTVIVVEHDEETIRTADYVVDIGPGAGEHGGTRSCTPGRSPDEAGCSPTRRRITGQYLSGSEVDPRARAPARRDRRRGSPCAGAREHNLHGHRRRVPARVPAWR